MPFVQWITLILGWFVIDRHNNRRELRKEKRTVIDRLLVELETVENIAVNYHTSSHHQTEIARDIKVRLNRIAKLIKRESLLTPKVFNHRMVEVRRTITIRNFDTPDFISQPQESDILAAIAAAKDALVHELETHFGKNYR